jgi:BirA family biotin operon repressor/biotin-[acetyl-CoA-carboxylase] ligase
MNIIKLSAINSTNDYLKQLTAAGVVQNFTLVSAESQTHGRGQMGAAWKAEPGKNLTFSLLVKDVLPDVSSIFNLNVLVAVSIVQALQHFELPKLSIKWPNDILTGNKKLGGILIENTVKPNGTIHSIIGIGLNVNQLDFEGLPKASSMAVVAGHEFDKHTVMMSVANTITANLEKLAVGSSQFFWDAYHTFLFKKDIPMPFEKDGKKFMGIIQHVTATGQLAVLLEDDTLAEYNVKEMQLLY